MNKYATVFFAVFFCLYSLGLFARNNFSVKYISKNSVNVTADKFYKSFVSKNSIRRDEAILYLLGVLDATEGTSWCGYNKFKAKTLREAVREGLKRLNEEEMKKRASSKIEEILRREFPCKNRV